MKKNMNERTVNNSKVLVTGGAGFIGSNLVETLLSQNNQVTVLDNFSTGKEENLSSYYDFKDDCSLSPKFTLIKGDIRNLDDCQKACEGQDYVLHQAALGSVPRSINDPITTNEVNINGFLNMLVAARDQQVKRFVYAASSSTYGDHPGLPKVEETIGKPLSPYAVTKYVNELYADVFYKTYGLETIGLRYFNVFGRRQSPDGAYAAAIPKFVQALMTYKSPTINGDGSASRDFTYIENVVQMNQLAALSQNKESINQIYNVACGGNETVENLFLTLRKLLAQYDSKISSVEAIYGPERQGDVKHSQASIDKAQKLLDYKPSHDFGDGIKECAEWYWNYLRFV